MDPPAFGLLLPEKNSAPAAAPPFSVMVSSPISVDAEMPPLLYGETGIASAPAGSEAGLETLPASFDTPDAAPRAELETTPAPEKEGLGPDMPDDTDP